MEPGLVHDDWYYHEVHCPKCDKMIVPDFLFNGIGAYDPREIFDCDCGAKFKVLRDTLEVDIWRTEAV